MKAMAFILGLFVGGCAGFITAALMFAASQADDE